MSQFPLLTSNHSGKSDTPSTLSVVMALGQSMKGQTGEGQPAPCHPPGTALGEEDVSYQGAFAQELQAQVLVKP